jgi:hypothetical protein
LSGVDCALVRGAGAGQIALPDKQNPEVVRRRGCRVSVSRVNCALVRGAGAGQIALPDKQNPEAYRRRGCRSACPESIARW